MDPTELIHSIDEKASLDFLAEMVRHKSYSQTDGERELASSWSANARARARGRTATVGR